MDVSTVSKLSRRLVNVAMGRSAADRVIRNGRWVNVQSGEIIANTDIAILDEKIAYVGTDAAHTIGDNTQIIEAENRYMVPGLLDGHLHVESGMLTVTEFVRAVLPWGTTGLFIDPHEIANVFGLRGVRMIVDEAGLQPIHVWVQIPSCVPSAPGLETSGASITPEDVAEALQWEGIIGLGEMMNFPGVFNNDEMMHSEMAETRLAGKVIGGHYAFLDLGLPFHAYVAGGPQDDHEGTRLEDAVARVRQGMKAMLRFGSAWHDVDAQIKAVTEMGLDPRHFILCTDDSHSETLVNEGHVNRAVRRAISQGLEPVTAIQMATLNTAEHFGVARDVGLIAPGRFADILLVPDLVGLSPEVVIAKGRIAALQGQVQVEMPKHTFPEWALDSVRVGRQLSAPDFYLHSEQIGGQSAIANVIGIIENQAPTRHLKFKVDIQNGRVHIDLERDLAKIALVERHRGTGVVQVGLVHGFGFNSPGAIGTTVAHDSHHMLVVGTDESDMALAANELARVGGGQIVVKEGKVIGLIELPIAGLMSNEHADVVANKAKTILDGFRSCGCRLNNPNMQLSLLALVVIPELRISDLGLVDVKQFDFIPLLEEK
ncbi:MAG: adenine deaminase [Anaerolineales bacterium]|nr:MAG: adenine deaminase [Anaerolineales bacterium]